MSTPALQSFVADGTLASIVMTAFCATLQQVLSGACDSALADDDQNASDNTRLRPRPKIMALP